MYKERSRLPILYSGSAKIPKQSKQRRKQRASHKVSAKDLIYEQCFLVLQENFPFPSSGLFTLFADDTQTTNTHTDTYKQSEMKYIAFQQQRHWQQLEIIDR
jgi:hypothetical protein